MAHFVVGRIQPAWRGFVEMAIIPAKAGFFVQVKERVRAAGIDDGQAGEFVDQTEHFQLDESFAERAGVAEVPAGHDDPVRHAPAARFEYAQHDRLLPFEAERVDAVHEIDAEPVVGRIVRQLSHESETVVEIAVNLKRERAVIERLTELAEGDFSATDEDDGLEAGETRIKRHGRGGVAGAGAGDGFGVDHFRMGERGRHAVVLEAA